MKVLRFIERTHNIREKHITITTLKMDYDILKTSKIDELDFWNRDGCELSKIIETVCRRIQKMLSHIELILKEIDRRIEYNLKRMPIHLEAEIEQSLQKHLRDFVVLDRLRIELVLHRNYPV